LLLCLGISIQQAEKGFKKQEYTPKIEHGTLKRKVLEDAFSFSNEYFRFQPLVFQGVPARTWVF